MGRGFRGRIPAAIARDKGSDAPSKGALKIGAGRGDGHKRLIDKKQFGLRTALGGYEADNAVTAAQIGYLDCARQAGNMSQEQASPVVWPPLT